MIFTYVIYNLALFFSVLFSTISERIKSTSNHIPLVLSFSVVFLFVGLRYNVGNDYQSYVYLFKSIVQGVNTHLEFGYYFINKLFASHFDGYKYAMIICAFITYLFLFLTLIREKILALGIFFIFTFELLFLTNDQIRQGLVIAVFLYAIYFIEQKKNYTYFLIITLAAILFHYSAFLLLPAYFINRKLISSYIWYIAIITSFVFYLKGFFQKILLNIISFIPYYGERYIKYAKFITPEELGSGLAVLFWVVLSLFIVSQQEKIKRPIIVNLYMLGMIIYLISLDFHLLSRAASYLFYIKILIFPLYIKNEKNIFFIITILTVALVFFELEVFLDLGKHGGFPYQTIFTE